MTFQLVIIWALVISVTVWFFRDERQRAARRLEARAAHFASAPAYRYHAPVAQTTSPEMTRRTAGLSDTQRRYFEELARQGQ